MLGRRASRLAPPRYIARGGSPSARFVASHLAPLAAPVARFPITPAHYPCGAMVGRRASRLAPYRHYTRNIRPTPPVGAPHPPGSRRRAGWRTLCPPVPGCAITHSATFGKWRRVTSQSKCDLPPGEGFIPLLHQHIRGNPHPPFGTTQCHHSHPHLRNR